MNPYFRLSPIKRGSAFYYANLTLEAPWPELGNTASTRPKVSARVIEQHPVGSPKLTYRTWGGAAAEGVIGVYLDQELIAALGARTWLHVFDHKFIYGPPDDNNKSLGIPSIVHARSQQGGIFMSPTVPSYTTESDRTLWFNGPKTLRIDIEEVIKKAYYNWEIQPPEPPTSLTPTVRKDLASALNSNHNLLSAITIPRGVSQAFVSWAIWDHKGFTDNPLLPVFSVLTESRDAAELYLDPAKAMHEAIVQLGGVATHTRELKLAELKERVKEEIEALGGSQ